MEDEEQMQVPEMGEVEAAYIDEHQDFGEYQQDAQEDAQFGSFPSAVPKDSVFTFFNNILKLKDSSKVGNLDKRELGMLDLSVRNCEHLGKLGYMLHNKSYGDFFMNKGEITLATSMSKRGWLPELVVSQKKYSQRTVQPMAFQPPKKGFLGLGGGKQEVPQSQ
jgi:hypothetical protein